MNTIYTPKSLMHREFFREYALMYIGNLPDWVDWCGGGSLDNGAVY